VQARTFDCFIQIEYKLGVLRTVAHSLIRHANLAAYYAAYKHALIWPSHVVIKCGEVPSKCYALAGNDNYIFIQYLLEGKLTGLKVIYIYIEF